MKWEHRVVMAVITLGLLPVTWGQTPSLDQQIRSTTQQIVSTAGSGAAAPYKAVYQYGLAPVVVGRSSRGSPIGYRLELLVLVPANLDDSVELRVRQSVSRILDPIAVQLRTDIDALPGLEESAATQVPDNQTIDQHFNQYAGATFGATRDKLFAASIQFYQRFSQAFPKLAGANLLAISLRPCADPACPLGEFAQRPINRSTDRFGKLYGWLHTSGLTAVTVPYVLDPKGSLVPTTARLDKGYEWHADFSKAVLQAAFTNAALRARRVQVPLSYSSAELAGLSREAAAHIVDVFDSAYAAGAPLPSNPAAVLMGISDELGRARLNECVRLRGAFDPADAGICAGYKVTQAEITNCLSGRECSPAFGGQVNLDSMTLNVHTTLAYFSQNAALPRVDLGTLDQVTALAKGCQKAGAQAGYCLVKASLTRDPTAQKALVCIQGARPGASGALLNCAKASLSHDQQAQIACFQDHAKDYKALALCATGSALPPQAQKFVGCVTNAQQTNAGLEDAAVCLGAAAGSREAGCLAAHKDDWQSAALCMAGDHIPPQVQGAVQCAQNSDSLAGFGVCMVASQGSGEAQRIAACYAESQGMPAAVAVCLAAKNLTQDQRIVLECAAQTSGAVPATAVCVGGKMAMREMMNCQGKNFGEGKCFGEGNEIRKFAKSIGLEIGPHSVVADIVNVQLRITDATVTPVLKAATDVVGGVIKVANDNGFIPDPSHPLTFIPGVGPAVHFCDHNPCPKLPEIKLPEIKVEIKLPEFKL
jgi:hypothetical protein